MSDFVFNGRRLALRALSPADAPAMFAYRSSEAVQRYQGWAPASVDEVRSFIERQDLGKLIEAGAWVQLGIYEGDLLVGDLGIHTLDDPRQVEIGITIAPAHQKKGFATEALRGVLDYLFGEGDRHRVMASIDPRNTAIAALLEKVGMRREAHHVESYWFRGEWVDDVIYARLRREHVQRSKDRS